MPAKFDDIIKVSKEVLDDDYKTTGYQLKTKQKTSFDGAVISADVDLWGGKDSSVVTPAKLTWKLPKPFGLTFLSVDKLEMDKTGALKMEAVSDKVYPGLKVKCTSDLKDPAKITAGATYTGLKDTQVIVDTKATNPQDLTCEITRTQGMATFGCKVAGGKFQSPDVALGLTSGPVFMGVVAKEKFSAFTVAAHYKASPDLRCAANYNYGGKTNGKCALGLTYSGLKAMVLKAKVEQDTSVSCSLKNTSFKGFVPTCGAKWDAKSGKMSFGFQLSVE